MSPAAIAALALLFAGGCVAPSLEAPRSDPAPTTEWHHEPIVARATSRNIVVLNHSHPSIELATVAAQLQQQYDWLQEWAGFAPRWVFVHVGDHYPCGMTIRIGSHPEMFLQAPGIFDTANNYAHEMQHAFLSELGGVIPHWFNESLSDMAWVDSEIALWLPTLDRIDWRSYELLQLRMKYGAGYFPKVLRALWRRRDECAMSFTDATKQDAKNELLVAVLSEAAGEDVLPLMTGLGFDMRTRERQRGY
ncbi:MAG: hypothetical protein EXS13_10135 [Planctomycetes bacterium]|nr:hypothetical protein [Planctomycetota bacterium]